MGTDDTLFLRFNGFKQCIFEVRYLLNFSVLISFFDGIRVEGVKESLVAPMKFIQIFCDMTSK